MIRRFDNGDVNMKKTLLTVLFSATALFTVPAFAGPPHMDQARGRLMRLHVRLYAEATTSPQVIEAQRIAGEAYVEMYKRRTDVLTGLYVTDEYRDLRLALYHTQRKLAGVREEIPLRIQRIMDGAVDALAVRVQITRLEAEALEGDSEYVAVRDQANALNAAYRQALRESLASIQTNPELVALCDELAGMQQSITGRRSVRVR